ncbi:MAG: hypothetical protein ABJB85_07280 [Nitrososphaerota archaeon]
MMQGNSKKRGKRKLYDELGNEINQQDRDIMNDIAQGRRVKYYKETVNGSRIISTK